MAEEKIFFNSGKLKIEGMLDKCPGNRAVVISHPHPLYGGSMYNDVVEAVVKAYGGRGFSTLRFNFRGVDGSEGVFDNGMGEQEDVKAALEYLRDLGKTIRCLAGYSFGSWVNALGLKSLGQIEHVIMISPPVDFAEFEFLGKNTKIKLVVVGDQDDLVSVESIKRFLPKWNPDAELKVIGGANHFYTSKTGELKTVISEFLKGL